MDDKIRFTVPGAPRAKGRPRMLARLVKEGGVFRAIAQVVTPKETRDAEAEIARLGRIAMGNKPPLLGPCRLTIIAVYQVPKSYPPRVRSAAVSGLLFHTAKPDADNVMKLAGDALNGIAFVDDSQCAEAVIRKKFGPMGYTSITVEPLPQPILTPADDRRLKEAEAGNHRAQTHAPKSRPKPATQNPADLFK